MCGGGETDAGHAAAFADDDARTVGAELLPAKIQRAGMVEYGDGDALVAHCLAGGGVAEDVHGRFAGDAAGFAARQDDVGIAVAFG